MDGVRDVVTYPGLNMTTWEIIEENNILRAELAAEKAKNELVSCSLQIVKFQI